MMSNFVTAAVKRRMANLAEDPPENESQYKAAFKQAIDDLSAVLVYAETHEFILSQIVQARAVKVQIRTAEDDFVSNSMFEVMIWDESGNPITRGVSTHKLEAAIAHAKEWS